MSLAAYGIAPGPLTAGKELPGTLDLLVPLGCTSVRAGVTRKGFDNGDGTYNTALVIEIASELDKRGMTWLAGMTTGGGVGFDNPQGSARAFAELARVLGDCPNVVGCQTENEPEHFKADLNPTPARWVEYQQRVYEAAKTAAPHVQIVTGGLGGMEADWGTKKTCVDWLAEAYRLDVRGYFDVLGFHVYSAPFTIKQSIKEGRKGGWLLREARRLMKANDDGDKQIIVSEHGVPTGGPNNAYTEDGQADWMRRAYEFLDSRDYVHSAYFFTLQDHAEVDVDAAGNPTDPGDFMGVLRKDGGRKKSADMYQSLSRQII